MISISAAQSAEQAQNYYKKENYYQKNSEKGYYHGNAAAVVGVKDGQEVDQDSFAKLLDLRHVDTAKKLNKGKRAGFDVTFSAPKSVSVLVEGLEAIGQDEANKKAAEIRNAHEFAVKEAIKEVERLALTRIRDEAGNVMDVPADGIVYASFQHDTARENAAGQIDPQLHTHNFIFNIVTYRDPKTGELKTGTIENKLIFRNKMYLGQLYRNALAKELQKLGYEIEVTDAKYGFFEIKGFTEEHIEEFSGRSQDIRAHLEKYRAKYPNASEAELLAIVTQSIKKQKSKIDRDAVRSNNFARMKAIGLDEKKLISLAKKPKLQVSKSDAANAIELAANGITEQNSTFSKEEILREAMRIGLAKGLTKQELEQALAESDNILLLDKNIYTTMDILEAERYVINQVRSSKTEAIDHDKNRRDKFLAKNFSTMTDGQKKMFDGILSTDSQFVVVQGDAGTGKTFSMKAIHGYISQHHADIEIVGLSFTGKAAAGLEADSGIKSTTIHSFLAKEVQQTKSTKKRLIIVDEAGLAGSKQIAEIVKIANERGDRVVFVGDTKQFKAIAAGDLFADMQKFGAETISLGETLRQKTAYTKELVRLTKERDIDALFSLLSKREKIVEQQEKEALFDQISDEFRNKKGDLLVIASKNADRKALNDRLREAWLNEFNPANQLYELELGINEMVSLSGSDRFLAKNYEGVKIQIVKIPGFKNGDIVEVAGHIDEHTLIVVGENGEKNIDLRKHADSLVAFRSVVKNFATGEKIVFTKNWKEFKNGEIDIIKNIDVDGNIELESGRRFNANEYGYFDYGYAITDYKAQGVTATNVAVLADPGHATINSFYTQVTRAKEDVTIYTTNIELLKTKIGSEATKSSTLKYIDINHLTKEEEHDNERSNRAAHQRDGGSESGDKRPQRKDRVNGKAGSGLEKFNYSVNERDGGFER